MRWWKKFWESSTLNPMAKTVKKEDINEQEIIVSFLQDEPTDHASLVNETEESIEDIPAPRADPPKEEGRRRKGKEPDYETLFIKPSAITARTGKMVYIRKDFHDSIKALCSVLESEGITLSGYIDNVLANHLNLYGNEMTRLYNEKHKGINIHKNQEQ